MCFCHWILAFFNVITYVSIAVLTDRLLEAELFEADLSSPLAWAGAFWPLTLPGLLLFKVGRWCYRGLVDRRARRIPRAVIHKE